MSKVKQDGNDVNPFLVSIKSSVSNQMASIYMLRLAELRPHVLASAARAMAHYPDKIAYCERIIKLKRGTGLCLIVGILFKELKKRPKLLAQYHKKAGKAIAAPLPPAGSCIIVSTKNERGIAETKDGVLPEYYSSADLLFLEDESGRVGLTGNVETTGLVSGIALAIIGQSVTGETFQVSRICHVGCAPCSISRPIYSVTPESKHRIIVFLSGLRIRDSSAETMGFLSSVGKTIQSLSERFALERVIIAGDSLNITTLPIVPLSIKPVQHVEPSLVQSLYSQDKVSKLDKSDKSDKTLQSDKSDKTEKKRKFKYDVDGDESMSSSTTVTKLKTTTPLQVLDTWLEKLCQIAPIDLLPGYMDPTNHALPQQPFDPCLIPKSLATGRVHTFTNPCMIQLNECILYGNSGQPITDLYTFCDSKTVPTSASIYTSTSTLSNAIDVSVASKPTEPRDPSIAYMEATLVWRHMAPTMPDSLACLHVGGKKDTFIFKTTPHVYFAGNQPRFASSIVRSESVVGGGNFEVQPVTCRLISIPVIQQSNTLVVFNLVDNGCISIDLLK